MKDRLCMWPEEHWDHKFLAWEEDPFLIGIKSLIPRVHTPDVRKDLLYWFMDSIVWVPFNPTAENMARYLLTTVGPRQLEGTAVQLIKVVVEETRKCSAEALL